MSVLLITGPPASGKNTVGELVAKKRQHCAAIDVDEIRNMIVHPHKSPWEGAEGRAQRDLSVRNACSLARNFADAGFDTVISEVITDSTHDLYRQLLSGLDVMTVLLLPTEEEISARLLSRPDYLSRGEMTPIYDQQAAFTAYDEKLDNTNMASFDAADWILERWPR